MRCNSVTSVLAALSTLGCCYPLTRAEVVCSSSNGPFCIASYVDSAHDVFALPVAPQHAGANLDQDIQSADLAKRVNIERVLKQFELDAALDNDNDDLLDELSLLFDDNAALFSSTGDNSDNSRESESPVVGSFAFSNENGMFEELDRMDGADMKEFFELALAEVVESHYATLDAMSPEVSQGLYSAMQQLKALEDFRDFPFQVLDASRKAHIRHKFTHHRLIEIQKTFEQLVIAQSARERQVALEASVFLFQLAHEAAAEAADKASDSTQTASADPLPASSDKAAVAAP